MGDHLRGGMSSSAGQSTPRRGARSGLILHSLAPYRSKLAIVSRKQATGRSKQATTRS